MHIYGLDSSRPPSLAAARQYYDLGYRFYCFYIDGNTPYKWNTTDILTLSAAQLGLVPITVALLTNNLSYNDGVNAGNSMLSAMQARGLSGIGFLDVENGLTPVEYVQGFGNAMHAGQASTGLYGTANTLESCACVEIDKYWLASWTSSVSGIPPAMPDWDIWQFADGNVCDVNITHDDFPFATIAGR